MKSYALDAADRAEAFDEVLKRSRIDPEHVSLWRGIIEAQCTYVGDVARLSQHPEVKAEVSRKRLKKGHPILRLSKARFPVEPLERLYGSLVNVLEGHGVVNEGQAKSMRAGLSGRSLSEAIRKFRKDDVAFFSKLAQRTHVKRDPWVFLISLLAQGAVQGVARATFGETGPQVPDDVWSKGECPVCGGLPALARLEVDAGARFLSCGTCQTEWRFPRMECPFCCTRDSEALGYFFVDELPEYRVDFCRTCKLYVKTLDERKLPVVMIHAFAEEVATLCLDQLAEEEGFARPA